MDDFRMANGAPVVKEMKHVVPRSGDNSDVSVEFILKCDYVSCLPISRPFQESQSDTGYHSGAFPKRQVLS